MQVPESQLLVENFIAFAETSIHNGSYQQTFINDGAREAVATCSLAIQFTFAEGLVSLGDAIERPRATCPGLCALLAGLDACVMM